MKSSRQDRDEAVNCNSPGGGDHLVALDLREAIRLLRRFKDDPDVARFLRSERNAR